MAHAQSLSGIEIMKEQERLNTGYHDEKSIGQMLLIGSHGEKTEREFEFRKLEKTWDTGDGKVASVARSFRIPEGGSLGSNPSSFKSSSSSGLSLFSVMIEFFLFEELGRKRPRFFDA